MTTVVTGHNRLGYLWVSGSIVLVTLAQLGMKVGISHLPSFATLWQSISALAIDSLLGNWPWLALISTGILAYGISMWCWLHALHHLPLSRAYPLLSLSYVTVYAVAVVTPALHEVFKMQHLIGIALILGGVSIISSDSSLRRSH